jgi:hydroxymethylglutaryl-CoA synthase
VSTDAATDERPLADVLGVGAYAPAYRLPAEEVTEAWGQHRGAGISTTAVPDADEDALTMAHEAGSLAVAAADVDPGAVGALLVGTTTPPYAEEALLPRLVSTLGLPETVATRQHTGSTRAGAAAIDAGIDLARNGDGAVLAIASDAPRGAPDDAIEHAAGAGAAAVVLDSPGADGDGQGAAGTDRPDRGAIQHRATFSTPYPGTRFREAGSAETTGLGITPYDREAFRETLVGAADALGPDVATAEAVALQAPDGSLPYRAAGALGVDDEAVRRGTTVHDLGDTGAASPLLGLATALADGHGPVALLGYGSGGGATAMWVDGRDVPVAAALAGEADLSYAASLRLRGEITPGEPAGGGGYVSVPSWRRTLPQRHRLAAGRCRACGHLAFPPSGACTGCGAIDEYEPVELPGTGTVEAATVIGQGGAPPEFTEQQARSGSFASAVVALDGPADDATTVSTPTQVVTVGDESVDVGDRVEATIRRIYSQEGVTRYGVKMRPAAD